VGNGSTPMTLMVLVDDVPLAQAVAALGAASVVDVLSFSGAGGLASALADALGARIRDVLPARDIMREAVPIAREKFVRFTAAWSTQRIAFGRDFRDAFRSDGRSAWWFTDLSQKNPATRPTFANLCELEGLRAVLARRTYERVIVACTNRDQRIVLLRACQLVNVPATALPRHGGSSGRGFLALLFGRAKRWALDGAATILARRYQLPATVSVEGHRRAIAFHTWFPSQWRQWRRQFRDRYYVDLPDLIRMRLGWQPFYACVLPAPSLRQLKSNVAAAVRQVVHTPNEFLFLERWTSLSDVCRIYGDLRPAIRYWWLETCDSTFRRSFSWDGIDIFPLARHDLRASMVRDLPYYELLSRRVHRMVAASQPSDLVTILETYAYGRAVVSGVRSANRGTRVIGFQHSAVNANQLTYRFIPEELADLPLPDVFFLFGTDGQRMLRESGVPDDRLVVTGARRFDELVVFRRRRREDYAALRRRWCADDRTKIVLVATNIWSDISSLLLKICIAALADRPETIVLVKPHPLHRTVEDDLRAAEGARARFVVVDNDLNELQASSDVYISAFSTSDAEAVAIGCPVVHVALSIFDLTPTMDVPGIAIDVTTSRELREAVDHLIDREIPTLRTDEFIERVFYQLDGRSGDRTLAAFATLPPTVSGRLRQL
jgi:surface carbohydrate biosynthesis protein (TIGR04326 family)